MVAIAPFLERFPVLADVPAGIGDSFSGEITFHLGAVRSAAADVDGDGRMVGRAGEELGRCGAANKRSRDEEEGDCHHQGTLPARVNRNAHAQAVLRLVCSPNKPAICRCGKYFLGFHRSNPFTGALAQRQSVSEDLLPTPGWPIVFAKTLATTLTYRKIFYIYTM